ncbi:MAG TPA: NUDIX domain-containing protein [Candidatus Saccharimonadales bacterium]|nr:NUDIX domain-containing protein [Candidatus Saccharimonadales bacterium]
MAKIDHAIVDILIIKDDKFLLVQESKPGREGLYNIPGGHVDAHETLFEAAVREAKEETGYDVELTGVIGIYQSILPELNVSGPVFTAKIIGGEATSSAEHPDVKWVSADELYRMAKEGELFTKYPPFAVNHYLTRGAFGLEIIASYDYTK